MFGLLTPFTTMVGLIVPAAVAFCWIVPPDDPAFMLPVAEIALPEMQAVVEVILHLGTTDPSVCSIHCP